MRDEDKNLRIHGLKLRAEIARGQLPTTCPGIYTTELLARSLVEKLFAMCIR
jgi:hypothetical protein